MKIIYHGFRVKFGQQVLSIHAIIRLTVPAMQEGALGGGQCRGHRGHCPWLKILALVFST
jgi:hypothetical protein